jgi:hypothetical protein
MFERKQQLAFRLEKIYFVKKHSSDVFKSLLQSRSDALRGIANIDSKKGNVAGGPVGVQEFGK